MTNSTKTLAICILSHNRKDYLAQMLKSISNSILFSKNINLFVFDNSDSAFVYEIENLCITYNARFYHLPNANQMDNYRQYLKIPKHDFIMLAHDDDIIYIESREKFSHQISALNSSCLYYMTDIRIDDSKYQILNYKDIDFKYDVPSSIFPWNLPAFPGWIYPMNDLFHESFQTILLQRKYGKYSDIPFLHRLIKNSSNNDKFKTTRLDGCCYIYRLHSEQDSFRHDILLNTVMLFSLKPNTYKYKILILVKMIKDFIKKYFICLKRSVK